MGKTKPLFKLRNSFIVFFWILFTYPFGTYAQEAQLPRTLEVLDSYEEKWNFYYLSEVSSDSIQRMLRQDIPMNQRLELLLLQRYKKGVYTIDQGETEAKEALALAQNLNKPLHEAMALRYLALSISMVPNKDNALPYATEAMRLAETIDDKILQADIHTTLYLIYKHKQDYALAIDHFLKSLNLISEFGGKHIKNIKSLSIANLSLENNNIPLAEKTIDKVDYGDLNINYKKLYIELKIGLFRIKGNQDSIQFYHQKMLKDLPFGLTFQIFADEYMEKEDYGKALELYHKALSVKRASSEYLSGVYTKIAEIYQKEAVMDSTEFYLLKSLQNAIHFNKTYFVPKRHADLTSFYTKQKKYAKAQHHAVKGHSIATANNLTESLAEIVLALSELSVRQGRYDKAYMYLREHGEHMDQLSKKESLELLHRMEIDRELRMWSENEERKIAYEVEQKDKAIATLKAENKLRILESRQQRNLKISLLIGSIMLIALLLITWSRYRIKQRAFQEIQEKNKENLLLMKEIHHRVKNNLQIVLSLLNVKSSTLNNNPELIEAFIESRNKIKAMAIIHQNLYSSNNFVSVPSKTYVNELLENIQNSYKKKNVSFDVNIENADINMAMAVPLGLILNELITNCYKYAFSSKKRTNTITVNFLKTEKNNTYLLEVIDNGKGLPENFNLEALPSFGMQLVNGLVQQLDGEMQIISNKGGTRFEIYLVEPHSV